jgi:hypothetical protein
MKPSPPTLANTPLVTAAVFQSEADTACASHCPHARPDGRHRSLCGGAAAGNVR